LQTAGSGDLDNVCCSIYFSRAYLLNHNLLSVLTFLVRTRAGTSTVIWSSPSHEIRGCTICWNHFS